MKTLCIWKNNYVTLSHSWRVQTMLRDPRLAGNLLMKMREQRSTPYVKGLVAPDLGDQEVTLSKAAVLIRGSAQCEWSSFCCAKLA